MYNFNQTVNLPRQTAMIVHGSHLLMLGCRTHSHVHLACKATISSLAGCATGLCASAFATHRSMSNGGWSVLSVSQDAMHFTQHISMACPDELVQSASAAEQTVINPCALPCVPRPPLYFSQVVREAALTRHMHLSSVFCMS